MLTSRGQTPASDLRNRMTSVNNGDVITTYSYDDAGNRVEEVDDGSPLYYLIDPKNPTGYAQPIEQREGGITGTPQYTFIMGNSILAQGGFVGVNYLLTDGHGSTRDLVGGTGTLSGNFNYDAYGNSLGFRPNLAGTIVLFGGDGLYDPASSLYFHSSGRQSTTATGEFIEADPPGFGSNQDPISLHKYLYAGGDPVNNYDPSGHDLTELLAVMGEYAAEFATQVGEVGTIYNEGATLKGASDLAEQFVTTGTISPIAAAALLIQFLPAGKLLGLGGKLFGDALIGVTDTLESVYNNISELEGPVGRAAQWVGEVGAGLVAKAKGFIPTNFPAAYHGLDQVFQDGEKLIIVEAKGGAGALSETAAGGQMSQNWINSKITTLLESDDPLEKSWGQKLLDAKNSGNLQGMVVSTPVNSATNVVGNPTFELKAWTDIGDSSF
jgi:RHS repeat-associated protein